MYSPRRPALGKLHHGFPDALEILDGGGAMAARLARGALEASIRYAQTQRQFGKTLGTFEAIQSKLSDMATEAEASRLLIYRVALLKDKGETLCFRGRRPCDESGDSDSWWTGLYAGGPGGALFP